MDLKKTAHALGQLVDDGPNDISKYAKAEALLTGFDRANRDDDGRVANSYFEEKIASTRGWFAILCGVGEDGGWTDTQLRGFLREDISKLESNVASDRISFRQS